MQVAAMLDAVPLPALAIRRDERIEAANAEAAALLGPGLAGRHFITALRQPALLDAVEACLRRGEPRKAEYLTNDGEQDTTFRVTARALTLDSGRGALVCFEDVTHLEQAGQMRRDFVANVSHELRTPLTALIGFIETLQGPARDDDAGRDRFLSIMAHEAQRMNRLVGDLLSLSRVEAEERVRPTARIKLAELVRSTLHGLQPLAEKAGIELRHVLPDTVVTIIGDDDQLRQVVTNLTENAIKYSGRGTQVTVTLNGPDYQPALRGAGVSIQVTDTGPGIEAFHIPRLTERFYRVDSHRSREKGGTGLGLAIVKHIVNRHRGRLRVDSRPGQGTTFTVVLPAQQG
ncbi:sensor histidine kinase [Citreimonas salinaria]|uniref:histidine kinase n=1 Tax=Citreimonas salinaria TaxID=321339 RepID=A0A1H3IFN2_9RHOB|nr:ATP-binding protein [Citreimonas salinaria]SDY26442.1 two-component system, OmpR family, phosphate regulon sensor histidine kinase PhoR [Citreimonas salinaria]